MNITYDKETKSAYVKIRKDSIQRTKALTEKVILDFNEESKIVGIELLDFSVGNYLKAAFSALGNHAHVKKPNSPDNMI